ncbi:hypothetical protein OG402_33725 [Streptomyces anulatus]|uniref:hypothetical protein n=1 Tax=Streptomyces anulatus TaxID=1892 RepID=UPI002251DC7D|nr:hypothetical protein [Streptomyces anulatus]MCX4605428.1 hypothetical protein [Streptomyces anulatus]
MTIADDLNRIGNDQLKRRVRAAEAVAWQALNITPNPGETATEALARIRYSAERNHPELLIRLEHSRQEILPLADDCGCDPNSDGYGDDHCESGQGGEYLCARRHLGWVCGTCINKDDDGPSWRPDRHEWPCPTVAALDAGTPEGGGDR